MRVSVQSEGRALVTHVFAHRLRSFVRRHEQSRVSVPQGVERDTPFNLSRLHHRCQEARGDVEPMKKRQPQVVSEKKVEAYRASGAAFSFVGI